MVVIFSLGLISSLLAKYPLPALTELSMVILLVVQVYFFKAIFSVKGHGFFTFTQSLLFVAMGAYIISIAHYNIVYANELKQIVSTPYFRNPRFIEQIAGWLLPFVPLCYMQAKKSRFSSSRFLVFAIGVCWWGIALLNLSRGLVVSLCFATVVSGYLFKNKIKPWLYLQLACLVVGFLLMILQPLVVSSFMDNKISQNQISQKINRVVLHGTANNVLRKSTSGRDKLFYKAWLLAKKHPFLGIGPMNYFAYTVPGVPKNAHPHNIIFQILAEWGMVSATLFVVGLAVILLKMARRFKYRLSLLSSEQQNSLNALHYVAYFTALITGLCYSMVSGIFVMTVSQMLAAYVIASCLILSAEHTKQDNRLACYSTSRKTIVVVLPALVMLLAYGVIYHYVIESWSYLKYYQYILVHAHSSHEPMPRFWAEGYSQYLKFHVGA